jgi:hypothetical protein
MWYFRGCVFCVFNSQNIAKPEKLFFGMFSSIEPLYFVKISLNSRAICVNLDLSKTSILQKRLPKTKFKQFLNIYLFFLLPGN